MEEHTIEFHYLKPSDYRTFHVDGGVGGPTPGGDLFVCFYLERGPIPQTVTVELDKNKRAGKEIRRTGRTGVIRELNCGIVMSLSASKKLHEWLTRQIKKMEQSPANQKK